MSRRPALTITLESLEGRLALSATPVSNPLESLEAAKAGPALGEVYNQYTNYYQAGSQGGFTSSLSGVVEMNGPTVGVDIQLSGNFQSNLADMKAIGLVQTATVPSIGMVEGFLPIGQLPAVAEDPNLVSVNPVYVPGQNPIESPLPSPTAAGSTGTSTFNPTSAAAQSTLALKGGPALASIYQEFISYEAAGGTGTFNPPQESYIQFAGQAVGVQLTTSTANLDAMITQMDEEGMLVTGTAIAGQTAIIDGYVPIANLTVVAANAGLIGMSPAYKPGY
jgi:hypothetical protein